MRAVNITLKILLLISLFSFGSCADYKKIELTSVDITSVKMKGFRKVISDLELGINNPAKGFTITDIKGEVTKDEVCCGTFNLSPIRLEGKTEDKYDTTIEVLVSPDISILKLLELVRGADFDEFRLNGEADVRFKCGVKKKIKFKDEPIPNLDISQLIKL